MDSEHIKVILVTANVGTIFKEPSLMFQKWLDSFLGVIRTEEPGFIALHCQELGGKDFHSTMKHLQLFINMLLASKELHRYDKARIFLDEDYNTANTFTALGNMYFVRKDIHNVFIWHFVDCRFVPVQGHEVFSGNIDNVSVMEKAKFPLHFFPEFKWSRKGYLRTRWSVGNREFDLVNVHLFHDVSNIVAMEATPSSYSENRKRSLLHTLQKFENDEFSKIPMFIFGDFNFRLDICKLVKDLSAGVGVERTFNDQLQLVKAVHAADNTNEIVLTLEHNVFDYHARHSEWFSNSIQQLLSYDREAEAFSDTLFEYDITFRPSYPFLEEVSGGTTYTRTRPASWCDRVFLSMSSRAVISEMTQHRPKYFLIGGETFMGDHKPVALTLWLKPTPGCVEKGSSQSGEP